MTTIVMTFSMLIISVIDVRVTLTCLYRFTVILLVGFVITILESSP